MKSNLVKIQLYVRESAMNSSRFALLVRSDISISLDLSARAENRFLRDPIAQQVVSSLKNSATLGRFLSNLEILLSGRNLTLVATEL